MYLTNLNTRLMSAFNLKITNWYESLVVYGTNGMISQKENYNRDWNYTILALVHAVHLGYLTVENTSVCHPLAI